MQEDGPGTEASLCVGERRRAGPEPHCVGPTAGGGNTMPKVDY